MQTEKQKQGEQGERIAAEYLISHGYQLLESNWRSGHLEVDLIVSDSDMLVFVEVKTRSTNNFGEPEEFVGLVKQRNLIRAASKYIQRTRNCKEVRFDIISIIRNGDSEQVKHIKDAFKPRW